MRYTTALPHQEPKMWNSLRIRPKRVRRVEFSDSLPKCGVTVVEVPVTHHLSFIGDPGNYWRETVIDGDARRYQGQVMLNLEASQLIELFFELRRAPQ